MLTDDDIISTNNPKETDRINGAFALVLYASSVERAEKLVHCMRERYDNRDIPLQPNTSAFNAMLNLWAKQGNVDKVSGLLQLMMEAQENGQDSIAPNKISFNSALLAHAKRGDPKKAREVACLMFSRYKRKLLSEPPDTVTLNGVLEAWARSAHMDAGQRADEVLQWMRTEQVLPDTRSYNCIIDAYSNSDKGGAHFAERLLYQMMDLAKQGVSVGPDDYTFTAVIHAWANDPSPDAAERACTVVKLMEDLQDSGFEGIAPAVSPYNALINAWAKSKNESRVQKVRDVLEHMKGRPGVVPNERTYSSVISAFVKSGVSGVNGALEFVRELEDRVDTGDACVRLNTACYNSVLSGLIRSKRTDALSVAEQLLQRMLQREEVTGDGPNTVTYNSIMNILLKTPGCGDDFASRAERVEAILNQMEDLYQSGRRHVKPSAVSYITCISAWARSNHRQKVLRAQAILRRMEQAYRSGNLDAKPNLLAYNALLNSCSFPIGNDAHERFHVARVALDTLEELRNSNYGNPDDITYATVLKTLGRCIPRGSILNEMVEKEFESCCQDGQVNDFVLRELDHASPEVYIKHFGNEDLSDDVMKKIPREWRRNVSLKRNHRGR